MKYLLVTLTIFSLAFATLATSATSGTSASSNAPAVPTASTGTSRQTGLGAASILGSIGSMFPAVMSNMIPLVLLFGLGALMVPALGLGLLLREGRRQDQPIYYYRSFPSFNINTPALIEGFADVFEKVMKALDNVEKTYPPTK